MVLLALLKVFVAFGLWIVQLFPKGSAHVGVIQSSLDSMGFLRLVLPFGTLSTVVAIAMGIVSVTWVISAFVWLWKLVKW